MQYLRYHCSPRWLAGAAAAFAGLAAADRVLAAGAMDVANRAVAPATVRDRHEFSYDGVLGTSLDVLLETSSARDAAETEHRILAEIDRLEKILSVYDRTSEISRVNAGGPIESPELAEVLAAYERWSARTHGVLSSNLAEVMALWREAETSGRAPKASALRAAFAAPRALNVDALGKGFIVDRAVEVARNYVAGGVVNIGGDLRAWGRTPRMVGIADPRNPADNATPLLRFPLCDAAVATSAGYARPLRIGTQHHSHLIDPRTLQPIDVGAGATVVAADCVTANAVAAAAAVLGARQGAPLARAYAFEHLIVDAADGSAATTSSGGSGPALPVRPPAVAAGLTTASMNGNWPAGFQVAVNLVLKTPLGRRVERPYVAVWVEGPDHRTLRTLTIWGQKQKYLRELTEWWGSTGGDRTVVEAVSRATRPPGAYTVVWDGRDDDGAPVPTGQYKIWVEINREHGHHVFDSFPLDCGAEPAAVEMPATPESAPSRIEYGPRAR